MNQLKATSTSKTEGDHETEFKTPPELSSDPLQINGTDKDNLNAGDSDSQNDKIRTRSKTPLLDGTEKTKNVDVKPNQPESSNHGHNTRSHSKAPQDKTPPQEISDGTEKTKNVDVKPNLPESSNHGHNTRSRSKTPQDNTPSQEVSKMLPEVIFEEPKPATTKGELELPIDLVDQINSSEMDSVDKDKDEIDPEVEFVESDTDVECCDDSPSHCNAPQPLVISIQTQDAPKLIIEDDMFLTMDTIEIKDHHVSRRYSSGSIDDVSITAVAGGDLTRRFDFSPEPLVTEESPPASPDRSISYREPIRNISSRRTIRSGSANNYKNFILESKPLHCYSPTETSGYDLVERVAGVKRKSSSVQLDEPKKFKESPGLLDYIAFPIHTLKNTIDATKKPKKIDYEESDTNEMIEIGVDGERKAETRWCSIM